MKHFLLLIALLSVVVLNAQYSDSWSFTSSSEGYSEITGGTVLGTAVVGSVSAASLDDVLYTLPSGTIPFTFRIDNVVHSGITVSTNGQVIFGGSTYLGHSPLSSTVAASAGIAVLARDLQGLVTEGTLGEMRYQVVGIAPMREFVIQWKNFKKYGTANNDENYNFQLRLQETTNKVRITYGAMIVNATNGNPQIGIRGNNNTEFVARTTTTNWTATTAATVNTATCNLTSTVLPAAGLCLDYTPVIPVNPPNQAGNVSPANAATQVSPFTSLNWASGGGMPSGYRLYLGTNNPPTNIVDNLDLGGLTSYNPEPDFAFSTTYYWQVVPYNQSGSAVNCPVWSFSTHADYSITALPYNQNYDSATPPTLPIGWSSIYQSYMTTGYVKTVTSSPQSTPNCVAMYNPTDINTIALLIAPSLQITIPANNVRVKFYAKGATTHSVKVGVMSNPTDASTFTAIQTITLTATWAQYTVALNPYTGTGRFITFKHGSTATGQTIYIDTVQFEQIAPNDLAALSVIGNTSPSVNSAVIYTVTIYNNGSASQNVFGVKLFNNQNIELATSAGTNVAPGTAVAVPIIWTPSVEGAQTIYGKVVLAGDVDTSNDQSPNFSLNVMPEGIHTISIGEGTQNARYPIDMYYKNSLYETLIYPNEMSNFIGQITGLKLYNNFTTTTLQNKPTKIWIGTTTLPNLANGWIPSTQLTQVFDGNVSYPAGQNVIAIDFPQPFMYLNGENLVFMFNRPMDTAFYSTSDYFKCQTVGSNRARTVSNDTVTYDPAAPTGGTLTGQFPMITLSVIPGGVGHISGTVLGAGNQPLAGVAVQIGNTTHSTTTNTLGQFNIINILPNTYTISFSKFGYTSQSQNVTILEGQTETINITMVQLTQVSLSGTIRASDSAAGMANATIQFTGYQNYTATTIGNGTFNLPAVYANQSYTYAVSCPGFTNATGTVAVGGINHTIPPITLAEVAYAPYGVVATIGIPATQVNMSWQAPDPNAVDITESFESATFPSQNWTRVINNTGPANEQGILPTWCSFGTTTYYSYPAVPTNGIKQAGIGFTFAHQDEWLISPPFVCPPAATLRFTSFVFRGSVYGDHYYVKLSLNDGQDWIVLWDASTITGGYTTTATPFIVDMQAYGGQQVKLAFHARDPLTGPNANMGLWYDWYIDNIVIGNGMKSFSLNPDDMESISAKTSDLQSSEWVRSETSDRALTGYKVWRLRAGQETNETLWSIVTPAQISTLNYADTAWGNLSNGTYRWAIRAIYTNGVASLPVLSNSLTRDVISGTVQGVVRKPNNQPLAGATISASGNTTTTNSSGLYSLSLPVGVYTVSCSAPGYQTYSVNNINIIASQSVTQNFSMVVSANEDDLIPVTVTTLKGNYPNPFNPETTISYAIKEAGDVRLEVFNLKGQKVRSLVNIRQNTGNYSIVFDAKDDKGHVLSSGVYLYRLTTQSYVSTRKMMLME
ncbi:MAG: hypothetical protein CVU50_04130 [Candidatus Cloacimonetes bacterium HGW-Cloacimonetes-3]|jgi:hypothetical protein|nr:MAG: hypothetical protein CVU50_04130 [Candidatus Cloacimonetes bacterium HGW-Cloacimonetes-3]